MVCIWWANFSSSGQLGWSGKYLLVTSLSDAHGWPLSGLGHMDSVGLGGKKKIWGCKEPLQMIYVKIYISTILLYNSHSMKITAF